MVFNAVPSTSCGFDRTLLQQSSLHEGDVLVWLPSCTVTSVLCDALKGFWHSGGDSRNRRNGDKVFNTPDCEASLQRFPRQILGNALLHSGLLFTLWVGECLAAQPRWEDIFWRLGVEEMALS